MIRTILIGIGVYFLLERLAYKAVDIVSQNITVSPAGIQIRWAGWSEANIFLANIDFNIENKNAYGASVEGFAGNLYYGQYDLGEIILPQPATIIANGTSKIRIVARISLDKLPLEIAELIQNADYLNALRVKGILYTSIVNIPIDRNIPVFS